MLREREELAESKDPYHTCTASPSTGVSTTTLADQSAERLAFGGKARQSSPFYAFGQIPKILLGSENTPFASRQRSFRGINGGENFCTRALALFPQRQSLRYRILGTVESTGLDALSDKCFLIGS
jgi:hypothetical protein